MLCRLCGCDLYISYLANRNGQLGIKNSFKANTTRRGVRNDMIKKIFGFTQKKYIQYGERTAIIGWVLAFLLWLF